MKLISELDDFSKFYPSFAFIQTINDFQGGDACQAPRNIGGSKKSSEDGVVEGLRGGLDGVVGGIRGGIDGEDVGYMSDRQLSMNSIKFFPTLGNILMFQH